MKLADYAIIGVGGLIAYSLLTKKTETILPVEPPIQAAEETAQNVAQMIQDVLPNYTFSTGIPIFDRDANLLLSQGLSAQQAYEQTVQTWTGAGLDIFGLLKTYAPNLPSQFAYSGTVADNLTQPDFSASTYSIQYGNEEAQNVFNETLAQQTTTGVGSTASTLLDAVVAANTLAPTEPAATTSGSFITNTIESIKNIVPIQNTELMNSYFNIFPNLYDVYASQFQRIDTTYSYMTDVQVQIEAFKDALNLSGIQR